MTEELPGVWEEKQRILVILAHPDDPEFFCGATLARWAKAGHIIDYYLLTCGDKGASDPETDTSLLCSTRHGEQRAAADIIGARDVHFMDLPDGYLEVHTFSVDSDGNLYGGDNQYGRTQKFVPRPDADNAHLIRPPWVGK